MISDHPKRSKNLAVRVIPESPLQLPFTLKRDYWGWELENARITSFGQDHDGIDVIHWSDGDIWTRS